MGDMTAKVEDGCVLDVGENGEYLEKMKMKSGWWAFELRGAVPNEHLQHKNIH